MKLTRWFKWPVTPTIAGWYEFSGFNVDDGMMLFWNGWQFGYWIGPGRKNWVQWSHDRSDKWRGVQTMGAS